MIEKVFNTQKQIFQNLLEETLWDYAASPEKTKGVINIGAGTSAFSFRNDGPGIPAVSMANAVLSVPYDQVPEEPISVGYSLNQYVGHEVLEIHSWQIGHCTVLKYGRDEKTFKRKLMQFTSFPAFDFTGLLVHIEWEPALEEAAVLTKKDVIRAFQKVYSGAWDIPRPVWKPELWFNGEQIRY